MVSGERELSRAVEMGYNIDTLFYRVDYDEKIIKVHSDSVFELSSALFDRVSMRSGSEEVIAILETKSHHIKDISVDNDSRVLVVEAPEKPGNIGALLRTAAAAGWDAVNYCQSQNRSLPPPNHPKQYGGCLFHSHCLR